MLLSVHGWVRLWLVLYHVSTKDSKRLVADSSTCLMVAQKCNVKARFCLAALHMGGWSVPARCVVTNNKAVLPRCTATYHHVSPRCAEVQCKGSRVCACVPVML